MIPLALGRRGRKASVVWGAAEADVRGTMHTLTVFPILYIIRLKIHV